MQTSAETNTKISRDAVARENIWNVPNTITLSRIFAAPFLLVLLAEPGKFWSTVFGFAFLAASLTDFLDGYLARRYDEITRVGKLLDPLADKLLVMTALVLLVAVGRIPAWGVPLVIAVLGREFAVTGLRAMASSEGVVLDAAPMGKWKTGLQIAALTMLLIHYPLWFLPVHELGMLCLMIATVITVWSGYRYFNSYLGARPPTIH
ncbi:MAG: CDP-diacylglycerol--glycerol-3-phosphate 3-phosphatidyltransferase [bacterium]|nr:CDP-diacylglycerol--glycerol-3-phosphate 3-phosphatidyltransferase [bacterium]